MVPRPHPTFDYIVREINLWADVYALAALLAREPCFTVTGQYEPVYDKPRAYADVQAEVANELANLPRYHARCKLATQGATREVELVTIPSRPGEPENAPWQEAYNSTADQASRIIANSQRTFGLDVAAQKSDAPSDILNANEPNEQENDDGPIFGEKATAPKT